MVASVHNLDPTILVEAAMGGGGVGGGGQGTSYFIDSVVQWKEKSP
jgi:hypothetical protein